MKGNFQDDSESPSAKKTMLRMACYCYSQKKNQVWLGYHKASGNMKVRSSIKNSRIAHDLFFIELFEKQ
jgi:hypothetical protein